MMLLSILCDGSFNQKESKVIHLGHNRSVHELAEAAIEEDVQAIALTSYQGGHMEFFKYLRNLLDESGCGHIRIFGGGGGTITSFRNKITTGKRNQPHLFSG
ncbi:MAG: cobalamin-dependent protein [Puia sp.]